MENHAFTNENAAEKPMVDGKIDLDLDLEQDGIRLRKKKTVASAPYAGMNKEDLLRFVNNLVSL